MGGNGQMGREAAVCEHNLFEEAWESPAKPPCAPSSLSSSPHPAALAGLPPPSNRPRYAAQLHGRLRHELARQRRCAACCAAAAVADADAPELQLQWQRRPCTRRRRRSSAARAVADRSQGPLALLQGPCAGLRLRAQGAAGRREALEGCREWRRFSLLSSLLGYCALSSRERRTLADDRLLAQGGRGSPRQHRLGSSAWRLGPRLHHVMPPQTSPRHAAASQLPPRLLACLQSAARRHCWPALGVSTRRKRQAVPVQCTTANGWAPTRPLSSLEGSPRSAAQQPANAVHALKPSRRPKRRRRWRAAAAQARGGANFDERQHCRGSPPARAAAISAGARGRAACWSRPVLKHREGRGGGDGRG